MAAEQSRAEQSRAEQSRAGQSRAEQSALLLGNVRSVCLYAIAARFGSAWACLVREVCAGFEHLCFAGVRGWCEGLE